MIAFLFVFGFPMLINLLIYLVVVLIIGAAAWYAISMLAPGPIQNFLKVIVVVIGAVILAYLLLGLASGSALR